MKFSGGIVRMSRSRFSAWLTSLACADARILSSAAWRIKKRSAARNAVSHDQNAGHDHPRLARKLIGHASLTSLPYRDINEPAKMIRSVTAAANDGINTIRL